MGRKALGRTVPIAKTAAPANSNHKAVGDGPARLPANASPPAKVQPKRRRLRFEVCWGFLLAAMPWPSAFKGLLAAEGPVGRRVRWRFRAESSAHCKFSIAPLANSDNRSLPTRGVS